MNLSDRSKEVLMIAKQGGRNEDDVINAALNMWSHLPLMEQIEWIKITCPNSGIMPDVLKPSQELVESIETHGAMEVPPESKAGRRRGRKPGTKNSKGKHTEEVKKDMGIIISDEEIPIDAMFKAIES